MISLVATMAGARLECVRSAQFVVSSIAAIFIPAPNCKAVLSVQTASPSIKLVVDGAPHVPNSSCLQEIETDRSVDGGIVVAHAQMQEVLDDVEKKFRSLELATDRIAGVAERLAHPPFNVGTSAYTKATPQQAQSSTCARHGM